MFYVIITIFITFVLQNLYYSLVGNKNLDEIHIHFNESQSLVLNLCLGLIMFGIALDLKIEDFKFVFSHIRSVAIGLFSQWVFLPILTLVLILIIQPAPGIAMGMALIAACPGGNVSNYAVHFSKANTALSIIMTSITTLMCVFTTPTIFSLVQYLLPTFSKSVDTLGSVDIRFGDMALIVLKLIIIPSFMGIFMNSYFPKITNFIKKPINIISMLIFISFVFFGVMSNWDNLVNYISYVFFIVLIHNGLALMGGYGLSKFVFGMSESDARTISLETGIQNSGLALIIIFTLFNGMGSMALIAAWWSVWHLISAISISFVWRRQVGFSTL
ncbi:MAG: bile acid:sodium symporter family protein [Saprospiraceae bacterium]